MFLKPQVVYGSFAIQEDRFGETFITESDFAADADGVTQEIVKGWFHRLSAPGYLDSTEWTGPFKTKEEAQKDLVEMWAFDDEDAEKIKEHLT